MVIYDYCHTGADGTPGANVMEVGVDGNTIKNHLNNHCNRYIGTLYFKMN